jgi:hypothetical protein
MFFTDSIDPKREAERTRLLQERNRLKAMAIADADAELRERIRELEAAIKRLDTEH